MVIRTPISENHDTLDAEAVNVDVLHYESTLDEDYIPEGFDTVEDFLTDMREEYQLDADYDRENRRQALDDKQFAAGEQWDPVVLQQRTGLPCLVINSVPQFTAQLVGDWRENKKGIKVVPHEDNDTDVSDVRADLIRAIENTSRASRVYDSAFESMVQCGDGAFRVSVEYARNDVFDQDIFIRPIDDALSVVWDRLSIDPTGRDANHVFVDDIMPKKEFNRKWPDSDPSTLSDVYKLNLYNYGWLEERGVKVTEYWRLVERERLLCLFANGSIRYIDSDNMESLIAENGAPTRTRVAPCTYAQMHLVTGFKILAGPFEYQLDRLPIIRMVGRVVNIGGRRVRYGLVRFMKDPVRLKNFWRSVAAEQLGYAPKAQWIATQSAVEGREDDLRKAHLTRDSLIVVNDEAIIGQNLQRLDPPVPQAALLNEAQVNAQDMKDVTGIHDASLGVKSNETSGRAINARQREGDIASLTFYDNGNASILEGGDVINQLISQIYDGTRVIRTIGEDEAVKFMRINDPMDPMSPDLSIGKYDVALTTGASYTTRRVEAGQAMMEAIQVWPQLMVVAGPEIVKAQDWPGADKIAEKLEEARGNSQIDPKMVQEMQQNLQKLTVENQAMKADKSIDMAKIQIDVYKAETDRIKALSDNEVDGNQMEQNAIQMILDHSAKADEHDIKRGEQDIKRTLANKPPAPTSKSASSKT